MLDDLKYIHQKDQADALGVAAKQAEQLVHSFDLGDHCYGDISNVVLAGMGGSGINARMLSTGPKITVPFQLVQDYDIPEYVGRQTLFIASSYSGNTEETLEALKKAEAKGAAIAVMAARGALMDIAKEKNYLFAQLPELPQPRYAVFSSYRALVDVLARAGVLKDVDGYGQVMPDAVDFLRKAITAWAPEVPTSKNQAKQLALELMGKSVVIYSGAKLAPAEYKWKIAINENAKQVAWCNQLPEFCHNEFIGWSKQPVDKPYAVVDLRSSFEHPRTQKRFIVAERLLSGIRPAPHVVQAEGRNELEQMLWAMVYGDFASIYLALLNGLDPAPVDLVEKFKKELDK